MPITLSGLQLKNPFKFSGRVFQAGLGMGAVFYLCAIGFLWVKAPDTLLARGEKLAAQTVIIERVTAPEIIADENTQAENPESVAIIEDETGALPQAPFPGIYEETTDGNLPVIRMADNMTPFQAYRRPFTPPEGKNLVAIVMMDVGLSDNASKAVMAEISPLVTVAVSPYAPDADFWMNESRAHGHETWLKLPVEPDYYPLDDTGPKTLLINEGETQNANKLSWALGRGSGYAGIVTGNGPAFMRSANDARPIMNEIYKRGLGFVDGDTDPAMMGERIATASNSAYANNNVWIDIPETPEHIAASLRRLEMLASENGKAIGFMHSTPLGLRILQDWIDGLGQKELAIAPLSTLSDPGIIPEIKAP